MTSSGAPTKRCCSSQTERRSRPPSSARAKEGQAGGGEVSIGPAFARRWFDLRVEPLRDVTGKIVGLIGAAVDNTARKEGEVHLRLLMRELTHRSKNLLAVIQAMARQTARHTGSVDTFMEQFGARLPALAASHDLLVQE